MWNFTFSHYIVLIHIPVHLIPIPWLIVFPFPWESHGIPVFPFPRTSLIITLHIHTTRASVYSQCIGGDTQSRNLRKNLCKFLAQVSWLCVTTITLTAKSNVAASTQDCNIGNGSNTQRNLRQLMSNNNVQKQRATTSTMRYETIILYRKLILDAKYTTGTQRYRRISTKFTLYEAQTTTTITLENSLHRDR